METGVPYTLDIDWNKLVQLTTVNTLGLLITNIWVLVTLTHSKWETEDVAR